jgi:hypothetical protein
MKNLLIIIFVSTSLIGTAQKGIKFPQVKGSTLEEKQIVIPQLNNKYSVIAIAFHRDAEDALKKWLNPLFDVFIKTEKKSEQEFDLADVYDVNFTFVPMISGFKRISEDFKKNTDKVYWPYIMDTEKTDVSTLQKQLGVSDKSIPYFYVVNKEGKIVEMQSGSFSAAKLDLLEEAVE